MTIHELEILPHFLKAIKDGRKLFEVRINDRGFQVGDIVRLTTPEGDTTTRRITYLLPGGKYGVDLDYCVFGLTLDEVGL